MRGRRKHRGISAGTVVMLLLTACVAVGLMTVLPQLAGDTQVTIDTGKVLGSLSLGDMLPELSLSDIPIQAQATQVPATDSTGAAPAATSAPTLQPALMDTAAPVQTGGSFTVTLGGSLMIQSDVRKSAYVDEAETYDFSEMISLLTPDMQADLCMVSLENLVDPTAKLSDTVTSDQVIAMLPASGVDAVALGFPKAYDQGMTGLANTINALSGKGITVLGAFSDASDAQTVRLMTLGGVKVAALHYTDSLTSAGSKKIKKEDTAYAVPLADGAAIVADMAKARQAGADVLIVSLNWGADNKTAPTKAQKALAQQLADGGADVIVGTGTGTVQPVTWLEGKRTDGSAKQTLCVYSLGCLMTDSRSAANVAGMLLQLRIAVDQNGEVIFEKANYAPTYIWKYKQDGQVHYRALPSDRTAPEGMSKDQQTAMGKALKTVQKMLDGSPLTLRE